MPIQIKLAVVIAHFDGGFDRTAYTNTGPLRRPYPRFARKSRIWYGHPPLKEWLAKGVRVGIQAEAEAAEPTAVQSIA